MVTICKISILIIGAVLILSSIAISEASEDMFPHGRYEVGDGPLSIALGDLNNDGSLDIVTGNFWTKDISVLIALPQGGYAEQVRYEVGDGVSCIALGDLNNDGLLDIVTANNSPGDVSVLHNLLGRKPYFLRGDVTDDGTINIADAINLLNYLFGGGQKPRCLDASDANDDGQVNISDAVYLLYYMFGKVLQLPPPFPNVGPDPTPDTLGCRN